MSNECKKLFGLMKFDVEGAVCNIGLEQELFFVPRDKYYSRQDLQFTGRTLGKMCARGQEGCDHYMGPINMNGPVLNCMQEIQLECYTCAGGRASSIRTSHAEVVEHAPVGLPLAQQQPGAAAAAAAAAAQQQQQQRRHYALLFCPNTDTGPEAGNKLARTQAREQALALGAALRCQSRRLFLSPYATTGRSTMMRSA